MGTSRLVRRMLFFGFPNDLFHIFLLCCSLPCLSSCVVTLDCFLWSGCGGAAIGHRNEFMRSLPSPAQFNSLYNSVSIEPMSQRGKDPSDPFFFFFFFDAGSPPTPHWALIFHSEAQVAVCERCVALAGGLLSLGFALSKPLIRGVFRGIYRCTPCNMCKTYSLW